MKKTLLLLVILGFSAVTASADIVITSDAYIGSGGAGTGEGLAGDRFRSFQPTGASENYLGVPSLGTAGNRVEQGLAWMMSLSNPLTSFDFTFQYDQANDKLVSTIFGVRLTGTTGQLHWSPEAKPRGQPISMQFRLPSNRGISAR